MGLSSEDFCFIQRDGVLFDALTTIVERGRPCDVLLVEEELRRRHALEQVESNYLHELAVIAPTVSNIGHWASLVVEASRRRRVLYASIQITREARDGGVSEQTREALHLALAGSVAPRQTRAPAAG